MPSLVVDGTSVPILHESQLASLLGLEADTAGDARRTAGDTVTLLDAWCSLIEPLDWSALTTPTRSRGRTLRNLTVNVFHPFELLPVAWREGVFEWDPDRDEEREATLASPAALHGYASAITGAWASFVLDAAGELSGADRPVDGPRGEIGFSHLLEQQRWHAAFHYRQLVDFIGSRGPSPASIDLTRFAGLDLPDELY